MFLVLVWVCLWLLESMKERYEREFKIGVRVKNVGKEVVMRCEVGDEIGVKVEERGRVVVK